MRQGHVMRWSSRISVVAVVVFAALFATSALAVTTTFTSTDGPITINDYIVSPTVAAPSPSVINVSAGSETVSTVTVTLNGLDHTCPSDLNVLVVAPNGSSVVLIAQVGSCSTPSGSQNVTFSDAAAAPFGDSNSLDDATGTWKPDQQFPLDGSPGNCNWTGSLVSPAPAGPYGSSMGALNGPASGTWKLYIEDGCGADSGTLDSWSLSLDTAAAVSARTNRGGYCSVAGNTRPYTGAAIPPGTFLNLNLTANQVNADSHYKGAVPANFLQGLGISCDVPPGYVRTEEKVGYLGHGDSGIYTYYKKA